VSSKYKPGIGYEHPYSHHIQIGSIIVFFLVWILDTFLVEFALDIRNLVPFIIRLILFVIVAITSYLLINFSHKKIFLPSDQKSQLVTDGVYSYVRHPMYLSIIVLLLAFSLLSISFLSLISWVIIVFLFNRMMIFEEAELLKILGIEYRNYMSQVPRWIPRISNLKK
jgi:protein-S-isoprenylcysteine O-methyltransferase Ste14